MLEIMTSAGELELVDGHTICAVCVDMNGPKSVNKLQNMYHLQIH